MQCIFCKKVVPSGIKRIKQHLAGGYGDAVKCSKAPEMVRKDMHAYLKKKSRTVLVQLDEGEQEQGLKLQRVKGVKLLNKNQENKEQQEYRYQVLGQRSSMTR